MFWSENILVVVFRASRMDVVNHITQRLRSLNQTIIYPKKITSIIICIGLFTYGSNLLKNRIDEV